MKSPFICIKTKGDFKILWVGKLAFVYCGDIEDSRTVGFWKVKRAILFFIYKKGIGIGHSFGTTVKAFD